MLKSGPSLLPPLSSVRLASSVAGLYLNVWRPVRRDGGSGEVLPVMLFFYGGSWRYGSAMFPLYDGERIVRNADASDVIVVAANYRLSAFGFLGSELLRAEDNSTGNFGIQDQRAAMAWVQRNAVALGADASRVMIFGESAGSASVANHLVRRRSWPLFSRAAMESGPLAAWTWTDLPVATGAFEALSTAVNCSHAQSSVAACLRTVSAERLLAAANTLPDLPPTNLLQWAPVLDGVELTAAPPALAVAGEAADVPVLLGEP